MPAKINRNQKWGAKNTKKSFATDKATFHLQRAKKRANDEDSRVARREIKSLQLQSSDKHVLRKMFGSQSSSKKQGVGILDPNNDERPVIVTSDICKDRRFANVFAVVKKPAPCYDG
mmetsp:Transcript_24542/g.42216  ORF Transcript_24542/g.42216 Transcript_24542/m.42216 type:complete len:117 (+) Transcript_24542:162-512(+)